MKLFVALACLIALIAAAPAPSDELRKLPPVTYEEVHDEHGQFTLRYVSADGTAVQRSGKLVPTPDNSGYVLVQEGEISYAGPDGQIYTTKFYAGLDGYHAEGSHLPTPPKP